MDTSKQISPFRCLDSAVNDDILDSICPWTASV